MRSKLLIGHATFFNYSILPGFASNLDWGTRENHGNVLSLRFKLSGSTSTGKNSSAFLKSKKVYFGIAEEIQLVLVLMHEGEPWGWLETSFRQIILFRPGEILRFFLRNTLYNWRHLVQYKVSQDCTFKNV